MTIEDKQEKLRQIFVDETKGYLSAVTDDPNIDICYSDAYVHWLENKVISQK